jgi:glycosyltransferase involved in cell wall biosynthesis
MTTPSVLLDMRPLQGPSAGRGIGSYATGLLGGLIAIGFDSNLTLLLDSAAPDPSLPKGTYRTVHTRRRYRGQFAAYEEAAVGAQDLFRLKPDLYHAINLRLPHRPPVPLVVTLHDLIPWAWGGPRMRGERMRFWPGRRLLRGADLVLAVSQATAADAVRIGGVEAGRVRVVYEAPDPAFGPRPDAGGRVRERWGLDAGYLLFVGALDARKDPRGLLTAWSALRRVMPDVELVVAGDPGPQAPSDLKGARLLGYVDNTALADLYSAAGCLVFPSRYEGFGLPCVEAMACGCPVVAYRNSSIPEVVDDAGVLVEDGDAVALGEAAVSVMKDPEPWRAAGLKRSRRFSWEKAARETVAAYDSVLARLR